jgi:hypothetical protein
MSNLYKRMGVMWLVMNLKERIQTSLLPVELKGDLLAGVCLVYNKEEDAIQASEATNPPSKVFKVLEQQESQ